MSALSAQGFALSADSASFLFFWLIFAEAKIKKGISPVATGDLRLCLKTPQTFEKV